MTKVLQGEKGYLYYSVFSSQVQGTADGVDFQGNGWCKIVTKGKESGLPASLERGDVFYNSTKLILMDGDEVRLMTMSKVAFVTNIPGSASKTKQDVTTQMDSVKSFIEGSRSELTGNIEGYFLNEDPMGLQELLLARFKSVIMDDGVGNITKLESAGEPLHFFLSRFETTEEGKREITDYMPLITDSLTLDKPMEGNLPFSFAYTLVGSERPNTYFRSI